MLRATPVVLAALAVAFTTVPPAAAGEISTYGDGAGAGQPTPIAEILADPAGFRGKQVKVRGRVAGVCPKAGCWIELVDDRAQVRIKVEDGVIVFPRDAEGKWAEARGKVEILEMDRQQYTGWLRHLAEERGEAFDESTVGQPPYRIVQIAGTGARIDG